MVFELFFRYLKDVSITFYAFFTDKDSKWKNSQPNKGRLIHDMVFPCEGKK